MLNIFVLIKYVLMVLAFAPIINLLLLYLFLVFRLQGHCLLTTLHIYPCCFQVLNNFFGSNGNIDVVWLNFPAFDHQLLLNECVQI